MDSSTEEELKNRIHQQEVVADIGQQALEADELDDLMHNVTETIAETLNTEYCHVLDLLSDEDKFILRQGVGWQAGTVGNATVPTEQDSQAGYTLLSKEPIIVDDLRTEDRFHGNDLLVNHDVVSGITVVIGSVDDPWGVLGTFTTDHRSFTEHDANFVQSIANILATVIEEMKTKHRLRERENELEKTFDRITDAFIGLDTNWDITYINDRGKELLDPDNQGLIGKNFWDPFEPALDTTFEEKYRTAMETQEPTSFEEYYPPLGIWFEVHAYPSESGLSIYFRDITERKERERKLRESERRYRTLAEHFPNGIVTLFDEDLRYTLAAGQAFDKFPVSPEEAEGRRMQEVWPDHVSDTLEPVYRAALDGEKQAVEIEYAGQEWIIHAVPVTNDDGDVFGGMTIAQDITERKEYQQQLEESNERLEQFAYAASHDLQEPLRMVSSYLQLLETRYGDAFDEDGEEFFAYAIDGAERMQEMIDGLLEYSRVDTQGDPLEPVDLDDVLDDAIDNLQMKIAESNAEIMAEPLPHVQGDESQLQQVFQNLLSNAIEYSGDDPPRIHIEAEQNGRKRTISIRDEGIGIDPDDQEDIFQVFQRLHSRGEHSGTGIGLALCQRIIERHGGEIWVDSELGEGATFSFTLPKADS